MPKDLERPLKSCSPSRDWSRRNIGQTRARWPRFMNNVAPDAVDKSAIAATSRWRRHRKNLVTLRMYHASRTIRASASSA